MEVLVDRMLLLCLFEESGNFTVVMILLSSEIMKTERQTPRTISARANGFGYSVSG